MFLFLLFLLLLLDACTANHSPMIFFGGRTHHGTLGFAYGVNSSSPRQPYDTTWNFEIPSEVNQIWCLEAGLAVLGTQNRLLTATTIEKGSEGRKKLDVSPLASFDGPVEALIEHRPQSSQKPMFFLGGMFKGGLVRWDGQKVIGAGVEALEPACVYTLSLVDPQATTSWDFFVGGCFVSAGKTVLNGIGRYSVDIEGDGSTSWQPLGKGVNQVGTGKGSDKDGVPSVFVIASTKTIAWVGGYFRYAGDIEANNIAAYIPVMKEWRPLGKGVVGVVRALAAAPDGSGVYVGGKFCANSAPSVCNLAWFDSVHRWQSFGGGVRGEVMSLLMSSNNLWIGGSFAVPATGQFDLAIWSGVGWVPQRFAWDRGAVETLSSCPCEVGLTFDDVNGMCVVPHAPSYAGLTLVFWAVLIISVGGVVFLIVCVVKRRRYSTSGYLAVSQNLINDDDDDNDESNQSRNKKGVISTTTKVRTTSHLDLDTEYQLDDYHDDEL